MNAYIHIYIYPGAVELSEYEHDGNCVKGEQTFQFRAPHIVLDRGSAVWGDFTQSAVSQERKERGGFLTLQYILFPIPPSFHTHCDEKQSHRGTSQHRNEQKNKSSHAKADPNLPNLSNNLVSPKEEDHENGMEKEREKERKQDFQIVPYTFGHSRLNLSEVKLTGRPHSVWETRSEANTGLTWMKVEPAHEQVAYPRHNVYMCLDRGRARERERGRGGREGC